MENGIKVMRFILFPAVLFLSSGVQVFAAPSAADLPGGVFI
jgi:hypothetical protein